LADRFDVAARLAEGRPAVEHTQTYVQACRLVGYQDPDLTAHGSQVLDWYESEAGLDLRVLHGDSADLRGAVSTIDEALWLQRAQVTEIAAAWTGRGADSATRFLQRHCDVAADVATHIRAAADGYAALRDHLWQLVDGKVATVVAVDDRRLGEQSAWLAAAHTVTARVGDGDRAAAEELVRRHVTPYVDNDIRGDWLTAIRSAAASVEASYDAAIEALTSAPEACFEIPGELGPSWQPVFDEPLGASPVTAAMPKTAAPIDVVPAVPTAPAAVSAPPPSTPEPPTHSAGAPGDWPSVPPELADPLGDTAGLSTGAGNLGSIGGLAGSIGGVVGKIVDGIGVLLGSLADGVTDPSGSGDPLLDDPRHADDPLDDDADPADDDNTDGSDGGDDADDADAADAEPAGTDKGPAAEEPAESTSPADDSVDEPAAQQVTTPPAEPPPGASPPAAPPPAPPEPQPEESTPCEIAEDELPQAGQ
jgi:hypothetical protein